MADVKWIKITTDIFDDEKMKLIDVLPERDAIIVIWFKLLAMAGKTNDNGLVYVMQQMATTDEVLATVFNRPLGTVRLALETFDRFGMIEIHEHISIINWKKHQNIEGLDKIREQNKLRQQKHRDKQKLITNSNVTVTLDNAIELELDKKEIREEKKNKNIKELSDFEKTLEEFKKMRKQIKKPMTDNAVKLLIGKLKKLADTEEEHIEILEQSIMNSWVGVFELKNKSSKPKSKNDIQVICNPNG